MYLLSFCAVFLVSSTAWSQVGKIVNVVGAQDAYVLRASEKIPLKTDFELVLNDKIHTENSYVVMHLYPSTQMSLALDTEVKISEHFIEDNAVLEKSSSVIDFIKGIIRLQVTKDANQEIEQKVQAEGVSFGIRGTEFEVSLDNEQNVDLDVVEGEVVVSSPYVHTFVPEIVKAKEGFKFNKKKRSFARRAFFLKNKKHPGFERKEKLKERWKKMKPLRKFTKKRNGRKRPRT